MFDWEQFKPRHPDKILWDVVVVGTGIGGSTIGYSLAAQGYKVLFLESGNAVSASATPSRLSRLFRPKTMTTNLAPARQISVGDGAQTISFHAHGGAPGGTSTIYGAALERFRRIDFAPPPIGSAGAASLANGWPLDYDEFCHYYIKAEKLFGICGTRDPLDPDDNSTLNAPLALSELDQYFFQSFNNAGLHPYRGHVGMRYDRDCLECVHTLCPRNCKSDAATIALKPALVRHGANIMLGCEVREVRADRQLIRNIIARFEGQTLEIQARVVVLGAGAIWTPLLLLRSTSPYWPRGIGNGADLVGRGVMFHVSDIYLLPAKRRRRQTVPRKALCLRDFYLFDGQKLGSFQSVGSKVWRGDIRGFLWDWINRNFKIMNLMPNFMFSMLTIILFIRFRSHAIFATIVEDFPYLENRLVLDAAEPSGLRIEYRKSRELISRVFLMRKLISKHLCRLKPFLPSEEVRLNLGHLCGTCRLGSDRATSVLDPNNKVWDTDNLYVVDASFFPTSAGVNPGLTIAANALRVGDVIATSLAAKGAGELTVGLNP